MEMPLRRHMYYVSGDRYKRGLLLAKEQQVPAQNSNNLTGRERALGNTVPGAGSCRVQPK
jgi:hypothetical protein